MILAAKCYKMLITIFITHEHNIILTTLCYYHYSLMLSFVLSLSLRFCLSLYSCKTWKIPMKCPNKNAALSLLQADQELHGAVQFRDVPLHHLRGQHLGASRDRGTRSPLCWHCVCHRCNTNTDISHTHR